MKAINRRIARIESKLPAAQARTGDGQEGKSFADFVATYHQIVRQVKGELAERGREAVVRRVLEGGSELERLAVLERFGQCRDTLMLLIALERGDASDQRLAWWREAGVLMLRSLLGEPVGPIAPFDVDCPELDGITNEHDALRAFFQLREKLKRSYRAPH